MEELLKKVYASKKATLTLKIISHASVLASVTAFAFMLAYTYFNAPLSDVAALALSAGIPFVAVSVIRRLINAPRPYELYAFYETKPKDKRGSSFPSRHVFSAFLIAVLSVEMSIYVCIALFTVGVMLAVSRVLLGIHFVRDAVAGAAVGILSGILGILIF